jgi:hypothetical protein
VKRAWKRRDPGVVLLLTLMVVALLVVLVGQFSFSAVLDRKVARNYLDYAKAGFAIRSASTAVSAYLAKEKEPFSGGRELTLDLGDTSLLVLLADEQGKFDLNALAEPPSGVGTEEAQEVFELLCRKIDTLPAGFSESVLTLVRESEGPFYTLGALFQTGDLTWETLEPRLDETSTEGRLSGIGAFLTVWSGGRINPATAPDEVIEAVARISGDLSAGELEALRKKMTDPSVVVPPHLQKAADRAEKWIVRNSSVYSAVITADRGGFRRKAQVVFRPDDGGAFRAVLVNELE